MFIENEIVGDIYLIQGVFISSLSPRLKYAPTSTVGGIRLRTIS